METAVAPILFAKQPPAEMTERGFLERFVGAYELGGIEVQVSLRVDGVLQFVQLGRAAPLVPVRGTLFRHAELEGVTLEFLSDAAGRVDRMAVHANGSVIAPRKR
jgi:hypothetical protein